MMFTPVTITADYAVVAEDMIFVNLGAEDVVVELPSAVAGNMIVVCVATHTVAPGTHGVVRVRPSTAVPTNKINGDDEVVIWALHSSVTLGGLGANGWTTIE